MGKVVAAIGSTKSSARAQIDAPGLDDSFSSSSDLGGTYASPVVEKIQGKPVAESPDPTLGQIIYWDGTQWYPGGPGGDLDGDYPSPIVVGLRGNPVGTGSPLTNQVLTWSGTEWVPGSSAAGGGGGGIAYFLDADNPGQAPVTNLPNLPNPPKKLAVNADPDDVHVDYGPLPTGGVYDFIVGFVTDVGTPGLDAYPAGIWDLNLWAESAGSASGDVKFVCKVYLYDGVNPPVFLAETDPTALYSPADSLQYTASVILPPTVVSTNTRLYLALEATAIVPGRSVRFHFGDGHPSYLRTSLPSVSGTGFVKVVNGAFQTPATPVYLNTADVNGILPVANGGTGLGTIPTDGQLLIGNGTGFTEATLTAGTGISITNGPGSILIDNTGVTSVDVSGGLTGLTTSGGPVLTTGTITFDGILNVGHGGTGLNTAPANGEILVGNGTGFTSTTLTAGTGMSVTNGSGSITLNNTGVTSVNVSGGTTGLTFSGGPVTTTGTITMAGTLGVPNGGTGLTASGASGNVLVSNGTGLTSVPVSKDGTLNSAGQLTVTGVQGTQFSSTPPTSGQLMQYNAGTGQWTPTTPAAILQTTYTAIYATENINRGDVVVATNAGGSPAGYIAVAKASALTADLSFPVVGISDSNLTTLTPLTRLGNAVITGLISGIDTHLLTQRRPGYISPTTPGGLTSTKPSSPNYVFQVGYCIDQSGAVAPFNGSFWVSPQSIINTQNLNDVTAPAPAENDLLIYKSATSLWTSAPLLKAAQTQTAVNLNAGNTITNAMIANVVYLPIRTNNNITLGANPIDVLTTADYGRMLWLHNVSNARSITLSAGGTTWLEGGVNLVLPANTMAKFMWLNVGGGAGRWVQTDKAITAF